jgi:hypothetical protein
MEKIVERVRKLLALAGNNPSEAEREAALRKAHAILLEHNLQMHDVIEKIETVNAYDMVVKYPSTWSRVISNAIANLYFCKFVYTKVGRSYIAHFIGMRVDAEIAQMVASNIIESVAREAVYHSRVTGGSVASFKNGAASSIAYRCRKMREQAEADPVPGTALVVQSLYKTRAAEAEDFTQNKWGKLKETNRRMRVTADESGRAGSKFGGTVSLTPKVGG